MRVQKVKRKDLRTPLYLKIITHGVMILGGILMLYPFVFQLFAAFSTYDEYAAGGVLPIPQHIAEVGFRNFAYFFQMDGIVQSLLITTVKMVYLAIVTVATSMLAGFVFQKYQFKGKNFVFMLFMSSMMIPSVATMVPSLVIMVNFPLMGGNNILGQGGSGLFNNPASHFVFGLVGAYNIFLVRQALVTAPDSLGEAAEIDGAGFFRIVFGIYLPVIKPIIIYFLMGLLIGQWNDYMFSMLYLSNNPESWTIGYLVYRIVEVFNQGLTPDYPAMFGIYTVYMIFPILVFLFMQKYFIAGLTLGAIKE